MSQFRKSAAVILLAAGLGCGAAVQAHAQGAQGGQNLRDVAQNAIESAGGIAFAEKCNWVPASHLLAGKATLAVLMEDFRLMLTAQDMAMVDAAIAQSREQDRQRPCVGPDGNPDPLRPQLANFLKAQASDMLVNLEAFDVQGGWSPWLRFTEDQRMLIDAAIDGVRSPAPQAFENQVLTRTPVVAALAPLACRERAADPASCAPIQPGQEALTAKAKATLETLEAFGTAIALETAEARSAMAKAMGAPDLGNFWVRRTNACLPGAVAFRFEPALVRREKNIGLITEMAFVRLYTLGQPEPIGWSLFFRPNSGPLGSPKYIRIAGSGKPDWTENDARAAMGDLSAMPNDIVPARAQGERYTPEEIERGTIYADTLYRNFQSIGLMASSVGAEELKSCVPGATY